MSSSSGEIVVRPLESDAEVAAWHRLSIETFSSEPDVAGAVQRARQVTASLAGFHPRQRRGAMRGADLQGGYICWARSLRVGSARLSTGCVGSVMTHPSFRMQGVATALMRDAVTFAEAEGHALLLLDAIPSFYHRYGYVDVFDLTEHAILRAAIPADAPAGCQARPATVDDAPALLAAYDRHYGLHVGSFDRTVEQQRGHIQLSLEVANPPIVAVEGEGAIRGYAVPRGRHPEHVAEVAADTWPAALALLQAHSLRVSRLPESPAELIWPLPPDARTLDLLAANLLPQPVRGNRSPDATWVIRSETFRQRNTGWVARLVSIRRLLEGMLPAFLTRLSDRRLAWLGEFVLRVDGDSFAVDVRSDGVSLVSALPTTAPDVLLTSGDLIQLVFGYRPISYLAAHSGARVPPELLPVVDALFPAGQPWIPRTDWF